MESFLLIGQSNMAAVDLRMKCLRSITKEL